VVDPDTTDSPPSDATAAALSADGMFDAVYTRLKAMAGRQLAGRERGSIDTTALVHELYLRVSSRNELEFQHPAQFFAYAARAMRHLLCDRARDRLRQRAGGEWQKVTLTGADERLAIDDAEKALGLDAALQQLERDDPRAAHVVELRYFAGLSLEQIAAMLEVNRRTVDRDWRFARAYLHNQLD
jgi:RNA polymerase sigma factor (TIGR02999 family)